MLMIDQYDFYAWMDQTHPRMPHIRKIVERLIDEYLQDKDWRKTD
jgi:hypothetical protein